MATTPQKAERPGDISSTIRHQISTDDGQQKVQAGARGLVEVRHLG